MYNKKIEEIELLRSVCCILVIVIHVTGAFWNSFINNSAQHLFIITLNSISRFVVPCFISISGFVLYYKYNNTRIDYLNYAKKRLQKILLPYLIWSFIYILLNYILYNTPLNISIITDNILLGSSSFHMYFMVLIIQFYILFPLILKLYSIINNAFLSLFLSLSASILTDKLLQFKYNDRFFLYYLVFFVSGFIIADLKNKGFSLSKYKKTFYYIFHCIVTLVFCIENCRFYTGEQRLLANSYLYIWWLYCLSSIFFMYLISNFFTAKLINKKIRNIVEIISQATFTIYLSHPLFQSIIHGSKIFKQLKVYSMTLAFIIEFFIIIFISFSFSLLIKAIFKTISESTMTGDGSSMTGDGSLS